MTPHGFNKELSDSLDLDRATPDLRPRSCHRINYSPLEALPNTSIIFVFCDELLSALLRSIHSVLNRSPPQLLHEIILVNDGSKALNISALRANINRLPTKITLLQHTTQRGLVQARLTGARAASGDTITVLDSHIEVQDGWLEPLMYRIMQDRHNVVVPHIRSIDASTFAFRGGGIGLCGVLMSMVEHSIDLQQHDAEQRVHLDSDPQPSPVMAGGLFSFDREFFFELGGYDEDMGFWGAENIEISFRIWMCGGRLELIPCSNVFHIFRAGGRPYKVPWTDIVKNKQRVIDLWLGANQEDAPYHKIANRFVQSSLSVEQRGSLDKMMKLRDRLQCKSFRWFLDNVYPENYFSLFLGAQATGSLRHISTSTCLAGLPPGFARLASVAAASSETEESKHGQNHCRKRGEFMLTTEGQLRDSVNNDICLMVDSSRSGPAQIRSSVCAWADHSERWYWDFLQNPNDSAQGQLRHRESKQCMEVILGSAGPLLVLSTCDTYAPQDPHSQWANQLWVFGDMEASVTEGAKNLMV